jgi:hypothetical protein
MKSVKLRNETMSITGKKIFYLCLALAPLLMGADGGGAGPDEQTALREQHKVLQARIDALNREQDYLLFRKAMYVSDSKYLLLDSVLKTGQLKYKNRVLKDFKFIPSKNVLGGALKPGKLVLTKKVEGKRDRHALVFGNALVIQWKRASVPPQEADIPFISLSRKDLLSVFFAVEKGALMYVVR